MPTFLKAVSCLGFTLMLALLAGCASTSGGTAPPEPVKQGRAADVEPEHNTMSSQGQEEHLGTLTVDAARVPLHAEPSAASQVVATAVAGDRLLLLERTPDWLRVRSDSGLSGFVQPSALVAPDCTSDRAEPRVLEEPAFRFGGDPRHGTVVIEAEFDAAGEIIATRIVSNSLGDPVFEQTAIADLRQVRFLPPTKDCKPRPFFYTFTREF